MALFSRRKKTDGIPSASQTPNEVDAEEDQTHREPTPEVGISVQAFRGVGAAAGPEVVLPDEAGTAGAAPGAASARQTAQATPQDVPRSLPFAPAAPPQQTESVPGMKDNVLLKAALAELADGATNEQLIGVLRQMMQSHLYLRVHGDASTQISEGKPLSVAVVRDGDRTFMLAFSSAIAVRESVQRETDPTATSAIAQPVTAVLQQVTGGEFAGLIIDNASGPHRAVFPTEVLTKALEQADANMTIKTLLATPRTADSTQQLGNVLATTKTWVAAGTSGEGGQVGIAELRTPDGRRFLQLFSHPLEIVVLGRGDRPLPFEPQQLAKALAGHEEVAGVIVDPAGPSMLIERADLGAVFAIDGSPSA